MDKFERKRYFEEIKDIEKIYIDFCTMTPLGFPKPINLEEEKKKFFLSLKENKIYNPQIIYKKTKHQLENVDELKERINNINLDDDFYGIKNLYKEKLVSRFLQVGYHENWGSELSCEFAVKYWKKPSLLLLLKAKRFCNNHNREIVKFEKIPIKECGEALKKEVKRLTGDDILIRYTKLASKVNIEPSKQIIEINEDESFTTLDVKRLCAHEVGVHYMRYYNARKFNIKLFELGTENYLETEEGLAAYNEYDKGVLSQAQLFVYAGRVIATYYCVKKSFYEVFNILKKYGFTDKVAFSSTFRAKRNLCDTSLKGGFTKDYVYFKGFYKVSKFAKNNDINRLFIGKVSIDNLNILEKFIDENYDLIDSPFKL